MSWRAALLTALLGVAALSGGLAFVYSGLADVAATSPHWALTEWVLSTTMERAVRRRASRIDPPGFLGQEARLRAGARAYESMCAPCHGAPGVEPGSIGRGLLPKPPDLTQAADAWSPAEIFWITKHGVRMTGMPSFGPTHPDEELWEIAALVQRLPRLSPEAYRLLAGPSPTAARGHSHAGHVESPHGHSD